MPTLLALETTTPRASIALLRDGELLFADGYQSDRDHNSLLFDPLVAALDGLGGERLDEVVIGTGPGSYSGTRVGIAAAQGVALVHACPAVGLSSLLATGLREGIAIGDARRGSAWWARIGEGLPQPELIAAGELAEMLGNEEPVFSLEDLARLELDDSFTVERRTPNAEELGRAWLALPEGERDRLRQLPPQPVYLRPPHVTKAKPGHPLLRKGKT